MASKPSQRIRLGMVGGGEGAFIGGVTASPPASTITTCSSPAPCQPTPRRPNAPAKRSASTADRIYSDYRAMAKAEAARADGIEVVSIVTPNHLHAAVASAFLEAGIHVICDKPVTTTSQDAKKLLEAGDEDTSASSPSRTTTPAIRWCATRARWCARASSARSASCRSSTRRTG